MGTGDESRAEKVRFAVLLRNLSRLATRAVRVSEHLPTLSESSVDSLRALIEADGLSPTQLAAAVGLSRPAISEVARKLEADGFVTRQPSLTDGRSSLLMPTERARNVLDAFARGRAEVMQMAIGQLSPRESQRLMASIPDLERLLDRLQVVAEQAEWRAHAEEE